MIKKEYDVIVAGGGMSGTCAAIAAARNDMSVLLIDQNGYLGGTLTANGVGPMMTFFAGEKQVIQGIGEEIVKRLKERGYSPGHVYDSTHYISYVTPFSAEGLKIVLDEMAIDSNVTLLYHTYIIGINKNGNTIKSIDIVNNDGISTINAKIFIDATGDGDLAVEAGIPFTLGRESDNATQPLTMNMKVYGVDTSKLKKTVLQNPKKFPRLNRDIEVMKKGEALSFVGFEEEFKRAKELGEITIPREDVLFFETSTPGEYIINTTRIINENGASALGLTNAEIIGRKQCEELYKFLIKYVPGFENSKIAYTGPSVGVRGSRQIQGVYKLTGEDLLEQKRFNSVIAHSGYPIDIHNPKGEGTLSVHVNKQEESKEAKFDRSTFDSYYSIPYEIMITKEIQNLIVTGRCVSASFVAQAAIRTTPTMTALGQAAGTAAALAIQTNQSVNKIDIKNLQNLLIAQGSYIEKK